jgi:pyruvate ferredoxin oxidoreductase gamma subunit
MLQIRIHGRGGQGVVTAAELLSAAAFSEGRYAQAFPSFGSERTGAPVVSFCRIDDKPIRVREPVMHPDVLIIQDPTLLHQVDVFDGAREGALLLINSALPKADLGIGEFTGRLRPGAVLTVPATQLAQQHVGRPVPNAALLGGFAALSGAVSIESVADAIAIRFPGASVPGTSRRHVLPTSRRCLSSVV